MYNFHLLVLYPPVQYKTCKSPKRGSVDITPRHPSFRRLSHVPSGHDITSQTHRVPNIRAETYFGLEYTPYARLGRLWTSVDVCIVVSRFPGGISPAQPLPVYKHIVRVPSSFCAGTALADHFSHLCFCATTLHLIFSNPFPHIQHPVLHGPASVVPGTHSRRRGVVLRVCIQEDLGRPVFVIQHVAYRSRRNSSRPTSWTHTKSSTLAGLDVDVGEPR